MNTARPTTDAISAIAEMAYVFSFLMLMGYRFAFGTFLVPSLPSYRGRLNEMHGDPVTLDHRFKDVISPNAGCSSLRCATPTSGAGTSRNAVT
jgi:hypothetical protein